ncbi:MAG: pyrroline-5-carboxylate reductase [Cyclobacteriaceae bacterium]|jgi:pyrroline-5-carboxylate reductase
MKDQLIISTVAGTTISELIEALGGSASVIRAMPNTASAVGQSMTCLAASAEDQNFIPLAEKLFSAIGDTLVIEERLMQAATVLGASGIAFFMRYLRAATQGGIQMGFHPEEAQRIAVQTAKGAATLILEQGSHPEVEIDKVTTPQGCTISGLNEMEHQGFSSALIKGLMTSFDKLNTIK